MADGTLIKNFALTTELNDDDDFLVEDSVPTTKRTKYSTLKEAVTGDVQAQVGDAFSEETDYSFGDYCIYKNTLYQFTADHAAGAWLGTDVEATTISAELSELNGNFISVAIAFDPSVTMFGGVKLQTYSGDVTFGRGDLDSYYVDSGEDGWYENITGELQTKEPNGVALSSKSESALVVVCRYEVSSQVDTDDFYLTSSNVKYTDTDGSRQYSKNENIFTVNASIEELPVNPSFAIEGPLICEEGAYYLMSSTTNGTSGTKDEMYYCTISAELYALNESTNGVHLADIHLIDSRTMEEFVIPDGFEIYASGEYKNLGNVSTPNDNDATIRIGISGSKDMESEINDFFRNEILVYGLIGYDSDDGLVVYFCQ